MEQSESWGKRRCLVAASENDFKSVVVCEGIKEFIVVCCAARFPLKL